MTITSSIRFHNSIYIYLFDHSRKIRNTMHSRSSLIIFSFLIILILFFFGSCSGRSLDDQPHLGHHDHGDFMDYLINSMARIFRLERYLKQEDHDEGKTILNVDEFAAKRNGKLDDTKVRKNKQRAHNYMNKRTYFCFMALVGFMNDEGKDGHFFGDELDDIFDLATACPVLLSPHKQIPQVVLLRG